MKKRTSNLDRVINKFRTPVIENLQNLESMDYENFVNVGQLGTNRQSVGMAIQKSINSNSLATPVAGDFRAPSSAAQMDFIISRLTDNIQSQLPVPIFGTLDRESDYVDVISNQLPAGCTVLIARESEIVVGGSIKNLAIKYTVGANSDIVTIACNQTPYVNYLKGTLQNVIKLSQIKLQISNVALQSQFSTPHLLVKNSQYGAGNTDRFTPNSYKSDLQNQNDIRIINMIMDFDAEKTLVIPMVSGRFTYTINSFVAKYEKTGNSKGF